MIRGTHRDLWNHWFWITVLLGTVWFDGGRGEVQPRGGGGGGEALVISQDLNDTDSKIVISKSVSVSKVSVKVGDVRIARRYELEDEENQNLIDHPHPPVLNPRASQPMDKIINHFLEQLRYFASIEADRQTEANLGDDEVHLYGTDEDHEDDYYSDYIHPSDEYLDYLYEIYDNSGEDYYHETVVNEIPGDDNNDLDKEFTRSEESSGSSEDFEEEFSEQSFENGSLVGVGLVTEEPVTANRDKLDFADKFLNVSKVRDDEAGVTIEDFVVELKSTKNSDVFIKIGIFITVTVAVLIMTGGLVFVTMKRKIKTVLETNLVTDEEHSKGQSQFVFQSMRGLAASNIQENFNNHFGKSSPYLYDDLHSLDNDSFLTSLETISEKDKSDWE